MRILFLCTHNSARSILAEAIASTHPSHAWEGFSAGAHPSGRVHPKALELALSMGYPLSKIRSKSWDEFESPDAPFMDVVITVCDQAAGEICPIWPGAPVVGHWGLEDPSRVKGTDQEIHAAFVETVLQLRTRLELLSALPMEERAPLRLKHHLQQIAQKTQKIDR
jgi:protein-tyrosine-phosphatase